MSYSFCSNCGTQLAAVNAFCQNCGTKSGTATAQSAPQVVLTTSGHDYRSKTIAALLALFFGGIGAHRFYTGQYLWCILYVVFCWTFVPMVLAFFEGIYFLCRSKEGFDKKHNKNAYPTK